jgi:hypothetical protein
MAITRIGGANAITGTLPATNINDTSIGNITALPAGVGGKVLQVVTATDSTQRNTNSTSFVTASNTLSVNITPSATSSKVFVVVNTTAYNNNSGVSMALTIYRDSSDLGNGVYGMINSYDTNTSGQRTIGQPTSMSVLDSPSSTSQLTYQVYVRTDSGGEIYFNYADIKASITAFEIAG